MAYGVGGRGVTGHKRERDNLHGVSEYTSLSEGNLTSVLVESSLELQHCKI